ncbi:unnamed protein product, partial [Durusdinium trenchii]
GGLSLSSPITRLLAEQIGKGRPASLLQKFASAAVEEAGALNVSASTRKAAQIGAGGKHLSHAEDTLHRALSKSGEAIVKCPISYVVVPVVDMSIQRRTVRKPKRGNHRKFRAVPKPKGRPKKKGCPEPVIVYKKWPVFAPHKMLSALHDAGALHLVTHPVHQLPDAAKAASAGIMLHGDEGQGKSSKSVLVISWSAMGIGGKTSQCRFPFAVMRACNYAYKDGHNITLEALQNELVRSLNRCISENPCPLNLVYVAGKGDWKWKREWLQESRHYGKAAKTSAGEGLICRRCFAGSAGKPWLDIQHERFNNAADLRDAAQTSCGQNIPLRRLCGWDQSMEVPDLLHTVWTGVAKDAVGSLMMDLAEFGPAFIQFETWDERLQAVTLSARDWCRQHRLTPSLIDDFSLVKLSVSAISLDYPSGPSHGFTNRILSVRRLVWRSFTTRRCAPGRCIISARCWTAANSS